MAPRSPALRLSASRSALLVELFEAASRAASPQEVLDAVVTGAARECRADAAILRRTADGRLEVAACAPDDPSTAATVLELGSARLRSGEELVERVVREGGAVHLRGSEAVVGRDVVGRDPGRAHATLRDEYGVSGMLAAPLRLPSGAAGILGIVRTGGNARPFREGDKLFLGRLAADLEAMLGTQRRPDERPATAPDGADAAAPDAAAGGQDLAADRRQILTEFMAAALQAGGERAVFDQLVRRTAEALNAACIVYRLDTAGDELDVLALAGYADLPSAALASLFRRRRWGVGEGVAGEAFASGRTRAAFYTTQAERELYLATLSQEHREVMRGLDLRAGLGVPLRAGADPIGALSLTRYGDGAQPFSDADIDFAGEIADRASIALGRQVLLAEQQRTSRLFQAVFRAAPLATYLTDHTGIVRLWNPAAERLFGWAEHEVVGHRAPSVPAELSSEAGSIWERVMRGEVVEGAPTVRRRSDGSEVEVEVYASPVPDAQDEPGVLTIYADVSERNRLQRDLEETTETLRAILDASPLAVIATDVRRRVTYWNRAAEALYGWTADEVLGIEPPQLIPGEDDPFEPDLPRVLAGETVVHDDVRRRTKTGSVIELRMSVAPIRGKLGHIVGMLGVHEDLRELRQLQADLARTWRTLATILASSPLAIVASDEQGHVIFWSAAAERLYGWHAVEVLGRPAPFAAASADEQDELLERVLAGEAVEAEAQRTDRGGRLLDVHLHASPLRDEVGRIRGVLEVHEDTTERRRLEAELLQAQKMETLGRLAGGIAHDFNNILAAVIGNAELALDDAHGPRQRDILEGIIGAAERAAGLTRQLLAFSRRQQLQPTVVSASDAVLSMESMLRRLIGAQVDLVIGADRGAGSVLVDRTQLEQVILNLAVNARDAMPDGGRLVIRAYRELVGADGPVPEGEYVVVSVADTGLGMDEETAAHIFEPFFTTKGLGRGTGLGLSTVYGIVHQSGGFIHVRTAPGAGSVFRLYFPPTAREEHPGAPAPESARGREGRVLLVDDDAVVRGLAAALLRRAGLDVVEAAGAAEALELERQGDRFDLLLTDVVMPVMTGVELAARLRERRPSLPVVFMSGFAQDLVTPGVSGSVLLSKPFTSQTLLRTIDAALRPSPARPPGPNRGRRE